MKYENISQFYNNILKHIRLCNKYKRFTKSIFEQLCNERLLGQPKIDSLHEYLKIEQRFDLNKGNKVMMIFAHILNIHPRSIKSLMRINTNVRLFYFLKVITLIM